MIISKVLAVSFTDGEGSPAYRGGEMSEYSCNGEIRIASITKGRRKVVAKVVVSYIFVA